MTSEKLSGLAAVSMDGTGKALASAFDAVRDSFASAATSLSASAATVEYEKFWWDSQNTYFYYCIFVGIFVSSL